MAHQVEGADGGPQAAEPRQTDSPPPPEPQAAAEAGQRSGRDAAETDAEEIGLAGGHSSEGSEQVVEVECPFCKYMRSGGCAAEFDAFMECGEKAEKGEVEYSDCMKQFEHMKVCMEAHRENYLDVLEKVDDMKQQQESEKPAEAQEAAESIAQDDSN